EVIGPHLHEGPLHGAADWRTTQSDDHRFWHCRTKCTKVPDQTSRATARRSATRAWKAWCRDSSSGARRIDDGWTVPTAGGPSSERFTWPRSLVTLNPGPMIAWAAVAPRQTIRRGRSTSTSALIQGLQAEISAWFGFSWM